MLSNANLATRLFKLRRYHHCPGADEFKHEPAEISEMRWIDSANT
jgi:hypothetical protein